MRIAYFDCSSGISGDMVLGALVDAGCELPRMEAELRKLPVSGWTISAEKVQRGALAATQVCVATSEHHPHRGLSKILEWIAGAGLAPRVAERASAIFRKLGEAEARVHNAPIEKVHFHEVGAVDAIVDIVGAAVGFELLGLEGFACSPLNVGGGRVDTAHGNLPVPAPATVELLRGAPSYSTGIERELVTPTGAAIVSTLAAEFGPQPVMVTQAVGYGAGGADLKEQPNVLRLFVGEAAARADATKWGHACDTVTVIEANMDDMNPQIYGYFVDRALAAGALDVFAAPVLMKKNRPGQLLTVLCEPSAADQLVDLIFRETTTIGVRSYTTRRRTLERECVPVETCLGTIRVKVSRRNGTILNAAPEYDDCQRIALERNVPLKRVLTEAALEFERRYGKPH
jgi:uncharacterized protein (TIGR00299 family) protein